MDERLRFRLQGILEAIGHLEIVFAKKDFADFVSDRITRAASERFLEIISEASRHIPEMWKATHPEIPWKQIADIGNHLRHAYHNVDAEVLWQIHTNGELDILKTAVEHMLDADN